MPPAGNQECSVPSNMLYEYEPEALSFDEIENRRIQQNTVRLFEETLEQVRALAEQIQKGIEESARIQRDQRRLRRAMRRQKRLNRLKEREIKEQEENRVQAIKMFFSCRERRQAFPELAREYLQSIS